MFLISFLTYFSFSSTLFSLHEFVSFLLLFITNLNLWCFDSMQGVIWIFFVCWDLPCVLLLHIFPFLSFPYLSNWIVENQSRVKKIQDFFLPSTEVLSLNYISKGSKLCILRKIYLICTENGTFSNFFYMMTKSLPSPGFFLFVFNMV